MKNISRGRQCPSSLRQRKVSYISGGLFSFLTGSNLFSPTQVTLLFKAGSPGSSWSLLWNPWRIQQQWHRQPGLLRLLLISAPLAEEEYSDLQGPVEGTPASRRPFWPQQSRALWRRKNLKDKTTEFLLSFPRNVTWIHEEVKKITDWDSMQKGAKWRVYMWKPWGRRKGRKSRVYIHLASASWNILGNSLQPFLYFSFSLWKITSKEK